MAKLSDEELLGQFITAHRGHHNQTRKLRAEILKRMGKVDVTGIADEIQEEANNGPSYTIAEAAEKVLRSHLEGKSE